MVDTKPKDGWDKAQVIASVIASVITPILLGVFGYLINSTLQEPEIEASYVAIAVDVLSATPTPETAALRDWAVDILRKYSPIKPSEDALEELRTQPLPAGYVERGWVAPGYVD